VSGGSSHDGMTGRSQVIDYHGKYDDRGTRVNALTDDGQVHDLI